MSDLKEGQLFSSFKELQEQIEIFKQQHFVELWIRDSRTIQAAQGRVKKILNPELKYYELKYACVHGGKRFQSRSTGVRASSTLQQGCTFTICLRASKGGQQLELKSISKEHNHPVNKVLFRHLPQQRKLKETDKETVRQMMEMKVNKKLLQQSISMESGKVVTLKDISNMARQDTKKNDLDTIIHMLRTKYGCSVEISHDEKDCLQGIFFQDEAMRMDYSSYPEIVFIDATYRLNELRMPVFLLLVEDSMGTSEVVGIALLTSESEENLKWMLDSFKNVNNTDKTRVVMADKDFTERKLIKQCFDKAEVLICLFHTLRSFKRELAHYNLAEGLAVVLKEQFQKMCYSKSIEEYNKSKQLFLDSAPVDIAEYFLKNWDGIKEEWVMGMKFTTGNFLNSTNNRLESLNGKLKDVISFYSSLEKFVELLFATIYSFRNERDHEAANSVLKVKVNTFENSSPEHKYLHHLTGYAAKFVLKRLELSRKVDLNKVSLSLSEDSCSCGFYGSMRLPCEHILAYRNANALELFSEDLCDERWTMNYFKHKQRIFIDNGSISNGSLNISPLLVNKKHLPNQNERFRDASKICSTLASLASEVAGVHYSRRMAILHQLTQYWMQHEEVVLTCVDQVPSKLDEASDEFLLSLDDETCEKVQCFENLSESSDEKRLKEVDGGDGNAEHLMSDKNVEKEVDETSKKIEYSEDVIPTNTENKIEIDTEIPKLNLQLPSKIKKRGRPKGSDFTVVGLPYKRSRNQLCPFSKLNVSERQQRILSWILPPSKHLMIDNKRKVIASDIKLRASDLPDCILDENVNVAIIKDFLSGPAWRKLNVLIKRKRAAGRWSCHCCKEDLNKFPSIVCESCLFWYHKKCVNLAKSPKAAKWFCKSCRSAIKDVTAAVKRNVKEEPIKTADPVILPNKSSWEDHSNVTSVEQLSGSENCQLTPSDSPFSLCFQDLKCLKPGLPVLGQVLDGILIIFSAYFFNKGVSIYILPETFFSRIHEDISLETTLPSDFSAIEYVVAVSFANNHWVLVLLDLAKHKVIYLDPMFTYVSKEKQKSDLAVIDRIIWYCILKKPLDSRPPIQCWDTVFAANFADHYQQNIPKQTKGQDCGLFAVMYFLYIVSGASFDFGIDDMPKIRQWCLALLLHYAGGEKIVKYTNWLVTQMKGDKLGSLKLKSMENLIESKLQETLTASSSALESMEDLTGYSSDESVDEISGGEKEITECSDDEDFSLPKFDIVKKLLKELDVSGKLLEWFQAARNKSLNPLSAMTKVGGFYGYAALAQMEVENPEFFEAYMNIDKWKFGNFVNKYLMRKFRKELPPTKEGLDRLLFIEVQVKIYAEKGSL